MAYQASHPTGPHSLPFQMRIVPGKEQQVPCPLGMLHRRFILIRPPTYFLRPQII